MNLFRAFTQENIFTVSLLISCNFMKLIDFLSKIKLKSSPKYLYIFSKNSKLNMQYSFFLNPLRFS